MRIVDLTGKRFGRLTVIKDSGERAKNGGVKWLCKCDCGNTSTVLSSSLISGNTSNCGRHRIEIQKKRITTYKEKHYVNNVDTTALTSNMRKDNKSGVKGVYWEKGREKWRASIETGGKIIRLGSFKTLEEAKQARLEAEEKYHKPYLGKKEN